MFPALLSREEIHVRLKEIFPKGSPNRDKCTSPVAASTVFTMLYIGAVEGGSVFLQPKHVYRMTREQALRCRPEERLSYARDCLQRGFHAEGARWYNDDTRESIRDDTLREGFATVGALVRQTGLATTANKPRYALASAFAGLFEPALLGESLAAAVLKWQEAHLSREALARVQIERAGAVAATSEVLVTFPNGETRRMAAGLSSVISKAVVEVFAASFLARPAVLWLSESGNHVVRRDDTIAAAIGLDIRPDQDLPDIILADLAPREPLLVFVEVVATDGPINPRRQEALSGVAAAFKPENVTFVTAFMSREAPSFRKAVAALAWRSFAWFVAEPQRILALHESVAAPLLLSELTRRAGR
jgi:hypothetical protein